MRSFSLFGLMFSGLARWWRYEQVPARRAAIYCVLLSGMFFFFGSHFPKSDYRLLKDDLADARDVARKFSKEVARQNSTLQNMRARDSLNQKTIELLNGRIHLLEKQSLHWQEQTAFYRHVLEDRPLGGEMLIHALDVHPNFTRQAWEVSAVLARPGKRKQFNGSYYLEVVREGEDGAPILLRLPAEGAQGLSMKFYHEIREDLNLPADSVIVNVRLVVLDDKGEEVVSEALVEESNDIGSDENSGNSESDGTEDPFGIF